MAGIYPIRSSRPVNLGNYIAQKSIERISKSEKVPAYIRESFMLCLSKIKSKDRKNLENIVVKAGENHHAVFYTPPDKVPPEEEKIIATKTGKKKTKKKILLSREGKKLIQWFSAGDFFRSLEYYGRGIPRKEFEGFAFHLWEETGIHPFTTPDGTLCYTRRDIDLLREALSNKEGIQEFAPEQLESHLIRSSNAENDGHYTTAYSSGRKYHRPSS
ncbi:hypothetical protein ACFL96_14360 [Thermoproteota archaeon]